MLRLKDQLIVKNNITLQKVAKENVNLSVIGKKIEFEFFFPSNNNKKKLARFMIFFFISETEEIGGFLKNGSLAWIVNGSTIEIFSTETGTRTSYCNFSKCLK